MTQPPPGYNEHFAAAPPPGYQLGNKSADNQRRLGLILTLTVVVLGVLSIVWGFLPSSKLELVGGGGAPTPLGSVFAVVGWSPALLLLSALTAAATVLPGVSKSTAWVVSAAAAAAGGLGALFYFFARPGIDAGLGFVLQGRNQLTDRTSIGLILLLVFGLIQLIAAAAGAISALGSQPRAPRRQRSPEPPASPYGYRQAGPPPFQPLSPEGSRPYAAAGQQPFYHPSQPYHETPQPPAYTGPQQPVYDPQSGRDVYRGQVAPRSPEPSPNLPSRLPPVPAPTYRQPTPYSPPPPMPPQAAAPQYFPSMPAPTPPAPDGPIPIAEYARTEYGSQDYEWEPTYSEAPDYEARAEQEADTPAPLSVRPEQAFLYETPEWERPQFEPPHFDSGRHPGWDAGFVEKATADQPEPGAEQPSSGPGWRSIPRAE